jgi:DNA-directed RNA polymerase I, II, and III subunit RPABC1
VYWYSKINTQIVNAHAVSDEKHILLIHERPIAAQAQSALKSIVGKTIEVFMLVETLFDPTKHSLVPKHVLCSEEEKAAVLNEYKATEEMFPPICATESISRWFGAKRGQMFAIHRMDTVHPGTTTLVYRIVR